MSSRTQNVYTSRPCNKQGRRGRSVFIKQPEAFGNAAGTRAHASVGSQTLQALHVARYPSACVQSASGSYAGLVAKNLTHVSDVNLLTEGGYLSCAA